MPLDQFGQYIPPIRQQLGEFQPGDESPSMLGQLATAVAALETEVAAMREGGDECLV